MATSCFYMDLFQMETIIIIKYIFCCVYDTRIKTNDKDANSQNTNTFGATKISGKT